MNRRQFIVGLTLSTTGLAGCFGVHQQLTADNTDGSTSNSNSSPEDDPDESPRQDNSTDNASQDTTDSEGDQSQQEQPQDQKQDQNQSQDQEQNQSQDTDQGQQQEQAASPPDADPRSAVDIVSHEPVFEEAADPQYGSDEFYVKLRFRNTADHPLQNVRIDGYAYVDGQAVAHEYIEYSSVAAGADIRDELPFFVDDPGQIGSYELSVSAAQWA